MRDLCERPGCPHPATVAMLIDTSTCVVYLEVATPATSGGAAALVCRRHADAMVPPRGWAVDDRREPIPRLFLAAAVDADPAERAPVSRSVRVRGRTTTWQDQRLPFDRVPDVPPTDAPSEVVGAQGASVETSAEPAAGEPAAGDDDAGQGRTSVSDETRAYEWTADFAAPEDVAELRDAHGPLLARAFRGQRPHR